MSQNIPLAVVLTVLASVALAVASVIQQLAVGDTAGKPGSTLSGAASRLPA